MEEIKDKIKKRRKKGGKKGSWWNKECREEQKKIKRLK